MCISLCNINLLFFCHSSMHWCTPLHLQPKYGSLIIKCAIEEIAQTSKTWALKTKVLYQLRRKWIYLLLLPGVELPSWKFWPSQRPLSTSLDPGRRLSSFWSSFGRCPVWCYPPICTWVLWSFGYKFPIKYLLVCSGIWHPLYVTKPTSSLSFSFRNIALFKWIYFFVSMV